MRLSITQLALLACQLGIASAQLDHVEIQRSLEARTWALETRDGLGDLFNGLKTCDGCQNILNVLKGLVKDGDDELLTLGAQLCEAGTQYDQEFCQGVVQREGPVIADIVRSFDIGSPSSIQFCMTFLGVCDAPPMEEWSVPFPSKKPCVSERAAPSGKKPIQVIQYSDIHIDPLYVAGSSSNCDKPTCCRPYTPDDEPGKTKNPAGPNGDHNCDTPVTLEKSMYDAIKKQFPDAAFTLFTGDIVDHGLWNTSKPYNEDLIEHTYDMMSDYLNLVYGTAGNHEADPPNIFEPKSVGNETQWVYDSLTAEWSRWVSNSSLADAKAMGYYSVKYPKGNLRIISLNTNMYYRFNFILYQKTLEKDPNDQIAWLVKELDAAEKAGDSVYILGHMPLGDVDALPQGSNYFDQVVKRYSSTIKAMFFGHTHVDQFEVSYSDYSNRMASNAFAISYVCPSLTPTSGMPSFRVYDVDPDTFAVLDATTYAADMNDTSFQTSGPVWKKYYSAKEVYGSALSPPVTDPNAELSPAFWHNVTTAFENNQTLFNDYMSRKSRGWQEGKECTDDCKKEEICALRAGRSQDNCWVPTPGVHFSKRSEDDHNHGKHDTCGHSAGLEIFSSIAKRQDMLELLQERFLATGAKLEPFVKRAEPSPSATTSTATDDDCEPTSSPSPSGKADGKNAAGVVGPMSLWAVLALAALAL